MDDSVKIRAVIDRTIAFQGPPPSTFRSEMGVLTPDQFPAGFNIRVACFFNRLHVHPAIWSHMPSDLARIRIEPTEDAEEFQGGQRPRLNFTFSFANATELTMPSSFMVFGKDAFNMLPQLMTASGLLAGYTPPHTEKMFTSDLQQVLGIHTMLLFADHSKVREPIPHAEIVRPGVRPSLVK